VRWLSPVGLWNMQPLAARERGGSTPKKKKNRILGLREPGEGVACICLGSIAPTNTAGK